MNGFIPETGGITPKTKSSILRDARNILFAPGVQIRLISGILLVIFVAIFPLILFYGGYVYPILFELFITVPLFYGVLVMVRKAANRETVSVRDVFSAFSRLYLRSIGTVLWFALLVGAPLLLPLGIGYGALRIYSAILAEAATSFYAVPVLLMGIFIAMISILPAILLQMPAYLLLSICVKDPTVSCFRGAKLSFRLMRKRMPVYLGLRLHFLLLDLLSCISVCALFPIYTIPLHLCVCASCADTMTDTPKKPCDTEPEINNFTIKTEDET